MTDTDDLRAELLKANEKVEALRALAEAAATRVRAAFEAGWLANRAEWTDAPLDPEGGVECALAFEEWQAGE